ncbi:MAG: iron ABC transporter permease [Lachnospiraceae bacterium]|nr:iron ABC transporter permease [Lachnospiraceae bacterium]
MKRKGAFVVLLLVFVITFLIAIRIGSVEVSYEDILNAFTTDKGGIAGIIRTIRIPRILMAVMIGANLSVSGVLLQAVMKNPLADPGITGISSGASVVVLIVMLYLPQAAASMPLFGFLGGVIACLIIYGLAWKNGLSAMRIVLAGVAVNSILGGITSMIQLMNSENLTGVLNWLNGELGKKSWTQVKYVAIYSVVGLIMAFLLHKSCDVLALGDKNTKSLGYNPNLLRLLLSAVAVLLAGISTAYVGVIGFIGLVVPHISRMIMGSEHKRLIPFAALMGSTMLLIADTVGRTMIAPYEVPVGVITTVFGGPFFLYLLRKDEAGYGD